jgi:hypothetical protein
LLVLVSSWLIAIAVPAALEPPFSWRAIATDAALKAAGLVFCAALIWICWLLVGASGGFRKFIASFSYWAAAWLLIISFLVAIDAGSLRVARPRLFAQITGLASSGQDTRKLKALVGSEGTYAIKALVESDQGLAAALQTPGLLWIASLAAVRGAFTCAWLLLFWDALRKMLGLPGSRAILSLALFLGFGLIAALLAVFFQMAPIMVDPGLWFRKIG